MTSKGMSSDCIEWKKDQRQAKDKGDKGRGGWAFLSMFWIISTAYYHKPVNPFDEHRSNYPNQKKDERWLSVWDSRLTFPKLPVPKVWPKVYWPILTGGLACLELEPEWLPLPPVPEDEPGLLDGLLLGLLVLLVVRLALPLALCLCLWEGGTASVG